jgi:hypothetical protein
MKLQNNIEIERDIVVVFHHQRSIEKQTERKESQIHKTFDAQNQSGGGGFISVEGFYF